MQLEDPGSELTFSRDSQRNFNRVARNNFMVHGTHYIHNRSQSILAVSFVIYRNRY